MNYATSCYLFVRLFPVHVEADSVQISGGSWPPCWLVHLEASLAQLQLIILNRKLSRLNIEPQSIYLSYLLKMKKMPPFCQIDLKDL